MLFLKKNSLVLFFLCWLLINLFQSGLTELFDDEAYYWVYSKYLSWGYFDHPPMIAVLIKAGYFLFPNEFGVRFFITILSASTFIIIYDLLQQKNKALFFYIVCTIAILQIVGFIAIPDIPLLFFTALFFWLYRRFLQKKSFFNALLLGLGMALMLYSKYHGVLIILFTLFSNLKLLKQPLAYMAVLFAVLLYAPHLSWQFYHGFPSVQYHLFERNPSHYKFSYTTGYILGQILVAGPFMGWLLIGQSLKYKPTDLFEKALKFSLLGIYLFFLLATIKGRVEANWTAPAMIPLILLSHQALLYEEKWKNILRKSVPVTLFAVLALRIYMIIDITPLSWFEKDEFHQNKKRADLIKEKAGGLPVVFINSYQDASKYWFYTGQKSFSLNTPYHRRNNFNFWPIEDSLQGKKVYAVIFKNSPFFSDTIHKIYRSKPTRGRVVDNFFSYSSINLICKNHFIVSENKLIPQTIRLFIPPEKKYTLPAPLNTYLYVYRADTVFASFKMLAQPVSGYWNLQSEENISLPKGKYVVRLAVPSAIPDNPSLNSSTYKLVVE